MKEKPILPNSNENKCFERKKPAVDIDKLKVPEHLKGVSSTEVIDTAKIAWPYIMRAIRKQGRRQEDGKMFFPKQDRASWFTVPSSLREEGIDLTIIGNAGCRHALRGGCTMCDYGVCKPLNPEELKGAIDSAIEHLIDTNKGQNQLFYANVITPGSLFDEFEMPREHLFYFLKRLKEASKDYKHVMFDTETRLEFVDEELLKEIRQILGYDVEMEVGYGFESANPLIREGILNKNLPNNFKEKIGLLRKYDINVINHVLIKPPFLTEKESIDDAVESINISLDDEIASGVIVMTTNIKKDTVVGKLHEKGMYDLASVWTVVEVMKQIGYERAQKCKFLGFEVSKDIEAKIVTGCDEFNQRVLPLLFDYDGSEVKYNNIMNTAGTIMHCASRKEFEHKVNFTHQSSVEERVASGIEMFGLEYVDKGFYDFKDKK